MRAGQMDRRIVIQSFVEAQDSFGEPIKTWSDFATVWAEATPVRGAERFAGQQEFAQLEYKFRIRYRPGITVKMRVSFDGALYDLLGVLEIGRREGLELLAVAHVP